MMDGTSSLTFADWERRSTAVGGVLQHEQRVVRGQCVGLFFDNHEWIEYAVAYCAVLKAGAAAIHLGPLMAAPEVQRRLEHADAVGVIHGASLAPPPGRGWRADIATLESSHSAPLTVEVGPDDLSDILYTSGTTGIPKGVRVTHGNNTFGREAQVQKMFEKSGCFLGPFPTGTSSAQAMINFAFSGGPAVLVMSSFEPERIFQLIQQFQVDNLMVAPATAIALINSGLHQSYDVSTVRMVSSGSTYIPPTTLRALTGMFPNANVLTHYGATEAVPALVYAPFHPDRPTSLGRPGPGSEIVICDDAGKRLAAHEVGEIWLRGVAPPRAYHKDPERNARVFTDGWTRMGDLGSLDDEGCLHLFDRAADVIRRNGELVSSLHIERALYECPQVLEAAVVGVPDPALGQSVAAAIVLKPGASIEDVQRYVDTQVPEQDRPAIVRQVDALPRGTIWKVLKRELRASFEAGSDRGTSPSATTDAARASTFPMKREAPLDLPQEYARLRRETPVARARLAFDGTEVWIVTGYREACAVLEDPRFSSDGVRQGFPRPMTMKPPPPGTFIRMDPPDHTRLRVAIAAEFKPHRIEKLRASIQETVDTLLDGIIAAGPPVDLVEKFALPLPAMVICDLIGVPYADRGFFHERIRVIGLQSASRARHGEVREELEAHLFALAELREKDPQDDLVSRLIARHRDVGDITREEAVGIATLLLIAGYETLANMIALGTVVLLENPERFEQLRREPAGLPLAVEELLRYQTVIMFGLRRAAIEDVEIGGVRIRAGDGVIVLLDAANRDEGEFPAPDRFDMSRDVNHHMAFGHGIHACIGQPLARLELEIAWATLMRRLPTLRLAVPLEQLPFRHEMFVYGVHKLPVTW